jgi:hypothetical protein
MTDLMKNFWPFAEFVRCTRCGEPVRSFEAVAVVDSDQLAGMAHETCPESGEIRGAS